MEETMWKNFYEKIRSTEETKKPTLELFDIRIQELDGGFFERFGSLRRDSEAADSNDNQTPDKDVSNVSTTTDEGVASDDSANEDTVEGSTTPVASSDSEMETEDPTTLITDAMGWNMDELYQEVLYEILHMVGAEETEDCDQEAIFSFLRDSFKFDQARHDELLEITRAKEPPNIIANVEVMEARGLKPKDANGLSDPFCTLYLSSASGRRFNTSVKPATLSPVWEEHLALPVEEPTEDILYIEIWDFDPAETVKDKVMKIGEVKGARGLRKLIKELAITVSTGKHDNELVGIAKLPLKNVPPGGLTIWLNLERKHKTKKQGEVKLRISFSSEKNQQVAIQEHRHLVRLMLLHELEINKVAPFDWEGSFPGPARVILSQHTAQCGLNANDSAFAEYLEFVHVHQSHPLSFKLFSKLMAQLAPRIQYVAASLEEVKLYWEAIKKFLPSCFSAVRKIRRLTPSNKHSIEQLIGLLSILARVDRMQPPENMDLFPRSMYGWLSRESDEPNCDIIATLTDAVTQSAQDWFTHICENNHLEDASIESRLKQQLRLVQLIRSDLQRAVEIADKHFRQLLRFPYALTLFNVYEAKVSELCEPLAREACKALKPIPLDDQDLQQTTENNTQSEDPLTMGTTLFELYIVLQRMAVLGQGLTSAEDAAKYNISNYHTWFHRGVAHWLDIALYKAMRRVRKAVDLDTLEAVTPSARHSSSAVDTLSIFYQIRNFWKELTWPDVEGSYTFVFKLIDDICRCSVYYADEMSFRVEGLGEVRNAFEAKFEVTHEWCLAINNISYVREYIEEFVSALGVEDILVALEEFRSEAAARHCRETLRLVVDNARETVHNKIHDLLEIVAHKMVPAMSRFLQEGAELLHQDSNSLDRLMKYLEENLTILNSQLYPDNFSRILNLIWNELTSVICNIFQSGLENRRPPSFFASLNETIDVLIGFFKQDTTDSSGDNGLACDALKRVRHQLLIHGMDTPTLIHQYQIECANDQKSLTETPFGLITVRAQFVDNLLRVQIMNARNLKSMDSNGSCDPYVKFHLLPEDKFTSQPKPRTKTHKKNMFPLFDETFTLTLTNEHMAIQNGLILFVIKDQDFLGMRNEFIGEAYLTFAEIQKTKMTTGLEELPQVHLKLNRPTNFDSESFRALDRRQGDKLAKDFIKRQKAKHQT